MDKVFQDAKDKYVSATMLYGKKGETKLYSDAAFKIQAVASEASEAFAKRALVTYDGGVYTPVSCTTASGVVTLTIVTTGSASAATLIALSSAKDPE